MTEAGFDYWTYFIEETKRMHAPLYTKLVEGIAGDEDLRSLAATVRKGQPMANIILAAVHYLLLCGADHPLKRFYPNLNGGERVEDENPFPPFKDFVREHRDEIAPLVASRVTNTNEVGRSAFLHVAFRALAAIAGQPLHLVEIGPSAGLNQFWDLYAVRFRRGEEVHRLGPEHAALVLDCELRGGGTPPLTPSPRIATRFGVELNPVDLSDRDQCDWLRALVWPDQIARFTQLEKALQLASREKPTIVAGDALALLPEVLARFPATETVCVYHTFVTYQFTGEGREALDALLLGMSVRRPLWRLSIEGTLSGDAPMLLYSYRDGMKEKRVLANCSPHGTWMEWLQ